MRSNRAMRFSICFFSICLPLSAAAQSVPLQPGKYDLTTTLTTSNVAEKSKPDTNSRCIKAADLTNVEAVFNNRVLAGYAPDPSCKVAGASVAGGKISYTADCKYATVRVEGTLTNTTFSVKRIATPKASGGVGVSTTIDAKRVGACE